MSRASSSGTRGCRLSATCRKVSRPTRSASWKVAVLGRPMAGPVSASTSSMDRPSSCITATVAIMACTPTRLAMKLGVSLASTMPLPRRSWAKAADDVQHLRVGVGGGDHLEELHVARRVEEVGAQEAGAQVRRQDRRPSRSATGPRCCWRRSRPGRCAAPRSASTIFLMAMSSLTTSMTQSASFRRGRSSSRLPVSIRSMRSALKMGEGLVFLRAATRGGGHGVAPGRVLAGIPGHDIQDERGHAGVGEVGGDGAAHDTGTQHGHLRGSAWPWILPFVAGKRCTGGRGYK